MFSTGCADLVPLAVALSLKRELIAKSISNNKLTDSLTDSLKK